MNMNYSRPSAPLISSASSDFFVRDGPGAGHQPDENRNSFERGVHHGMDNRACGQSAADHPWMSLCRIPPGPPGRDRGSFKKEIPPFMRSRERPGCSIGRDEPRQEVPGDTRRRRAGDLPSLLFGGQPASPAKRNRCPCTKVLSGIPRGRLERDRISGSRTRKRGKQRRRPKSAPSGRIRSFLKFGQLAGWSKSKGSENNLQSTPSRCKPESCRTTIRRAKKLGGSLRSTVGSPTRPGK